MPKEPKRIQFYLTVNEGKWFIADAISRMDAVIQAKQAGKVVLKGGTTVSCLAELLFNKPLHISGRLTPRGAKVAKTTDKKPHCLLVHQGEETILDDIADEALLELGSGDVMIISANIIDVMGNAAMLAGSPAGGCYGRAVSAMTVEGLTVIVAAGLEKLIPGSVTDSVLLSRRKEVDFSHGLSCGLFPIYGHAVVTELSAIRLFADVDAVVIGRGGIQGAEGGTLIQAWGSEGQIALLEEAIKRCKGKPISGDEVSLLECVPSQETCRHLSCCYKQGGTD